MSELRFYVTTSEKNAAHILDLMTPVFEDDDFPIATTEVDEKNDIWEASVYLQAEDEDVVLQRLQPLLAEAFPELEIQREVLPDIDWIAKSLEGLMPVRAGRFLVHGSHDRDKVQPGDVAIEIDAGQAFGTGHHGTTAGCLEMIEEVMGSRTVANALDVGTGSGVLAIAVRKLKQVPVLATDIDPVATQVAEENGARNGIDEGIAFETVDGFQSPVFAENGPFDLIIANILARPLMEMAPELVAHVAPGGSVILSGILDEQHDKVLSAYVAAHMRHVRTISLNGWVTIHLDRP